MYCLDYTKTKFISCLRLLIAENDCESYKNKCGLVNSLTFSGYTLTSYFPNCPDSNVLELTLKYSFQFKMKSHAVLWLHPLFTNNSLTFYHLASTLSYFYQAKAFL